MKKVIALLAAASGLPKTALASCVNDDGSFNEEEYAKHEPKISQGIEAKLAQAKEEAAKEAEKAFEGKGTFDDGFKKGEAKAHEKVEKRLRESFKVTEKLSGEELLEHIAANKDKAPKEITQDTVERQPWYQALMEKKEKDHKEEIEKVKQEHEKFKGEVSRKDRMAQVNKLVMPLIEELNLNLSKDPQRRQSQIDTILEKIHATDYDIQDERVLVLKDGKVMKDKLDNSVPFKDHITSIATSLYDPLESKERESSGVKQPPKEGEKSKGWKGEVPKTKEEIEKALVNPDIPPEERMSLLQEIKGA